MSLDCIEWCYGGDEGNTKLTLYRGLEGYCVSVVHVIVHFGI